MLTVIPFGKWTGVPFTRAPNSEIINLASFKNDDEVRDTANQEMIRRGLYKSRIYITHHAIDRASQKFLDEFIQTHEDNEGICHWLHRIACDAFDKGVIKKNDYSSSIVDDMVLIIDSKEVKIPTLVSVFRKHKEIET